MGIAFVFIRRDLALDLPAQVRQEAAEFEYVASGNYPKGHGPSQVDEYLGLLNPNAQNKWIPGGWLRPLRFTYGLYDVNAWWEQPGLIVYQTRLNQERVAVTITVACMLGLAKVIETIKQAKERLGELPGQLPPLPEPNPLVPPVPGVVPVPIVPVPIIP